MPLFRRKKEAVPAELEPFYEKEPTWRIWLRRVVALLVLIALIAAIVWAAVTVYRQVTNQDVAVDNNGSETSEGDSDQIPYLPDGSGDDEQSSGADGQGSEQPADNDDSTSEQTDGAAGGSNGANGSQDGTGSTDQSGGSNGGAAQGDADNLPNTGPADVAVIVLVATVLGAAGYQIKLRRQS